MTKRLAAWVLAVAIMAVPVAGAAQERQPSQPAIPKEIKELLPNAQDGEKRKQKQRMQEDQVLPEPIMDENQAPITKEIPS